MLIGKPTWAENNYIAISSSMMKFSNEGINIKIIK